MSIIEEAKGGNEKEGTEGIGEETEQVLGHGIVHNKSTTSIAICSFLFRLVVRITMILNKF